MSHFNVSLIVWEKSRDRVHKPPFLSTSPWLKRNFSLMVWFSADDLFVCLFFISRLRGLTFSWWGCHGLCHRHKLTKFAHSFLSCSCVCFCLYGHFNSVSFHKFFAFSLCSSVLNSAFFGPFNYISLYESLPQPRCNPLWLTGLKAATNSILTSHSPSLSPFRIDIITWSPDSVMLTY